METDAAFVASHWPVLSAYFAEMIEQEEGVKPSNAVLNAILRNFQNGSAVLWVASSESKLVGFFVTSKYFGGPVQSNTLYITYLRGIERISKGTFEQGFELVKAHAKRLGCTMIAATVRSSKFKEIAVNFGADSGHRVTWRI